MSRTTLTPLILAAALMAAPRLCAQSAHWEPPGGSLPVGQVSSLQLVFEDCSPEDTPAPPKVDGLRMDFQGQTSEVSLINGSFSRNVTLTYAILLSKSQEVLIPEFIVKTNKGPLHVPAAHFSASGATVGSTGVALGDAAQARMTALPESVWAGEVFDLKYAIDVAEGYYPSWGRGTFEWDPSPLVAEDWSQPEPFTDHGTPNRTGLSYHTRAIAPNPGRIRLNPTSQLLNLSVGVTGFGFFQQRQYQQFAVPDSPVSIDVRPLPPAPAGFAGAVGDFRIASKVVPRSVRVGEPVTWTIELSGSGNWPEIRGLPSREAPRDFQVIQPKPKRTQPQGKLFEGTLSEDVVLVPTAPGTFELPPLDFVYFDPGSGAYRTISAPGATVTAEPASSVSLNPGQAPAAPGAPQITLSTPTTEAKPPEPPSAGLGDPVPGPATAPPPLRRRTVALGAAAPFALLLLFWGALALRRAADTDPLKPRREARTRLESLITALRAAPSSERPPLLLSWQRESAVLWEIELAAPPATAIGDPAWSTLWSEAERFLYSADSALPADWVARAEEALKAKKLPPFRTARLFLPRNLFPALLLALVASTPCLSSDEPQAAYRSGDFANAEKAWQSQVSADPLDWTARHNLSLALAQQDRWGEAAAEASSAFVLAPDAPAAVRQLVLSCDKAGFVPEPLDALLRQGPVESLARLHSPGAWQRIGIASASLLAAALALLLAAAYGKLRRSWAIPTSAALAGVALLVAVASYVGHGAYGIMADTRAVIVWRAGILRSIPTEADVAQKTTPLAAGSAAIADKAFLGWIRVAFPNGETGWILRKEAVFLWRPQEEPAAPSHRPPG
ncbi:MAG: BatD family protein [Opitutaceae bacterium]